MRKLFTSSVVLLVIAIAFLMLYISPSYSKGKELRSILLHASNVSASEYGLSRRDRTYADVLTSKDLTPQQTQLISDSFLALGWIDAGKKCYFEPHHQLICTMKDGSTHLIHLCFTCSDIAIDSEAPFDMHLWAESLKHNFVESGIPVRIEAYRFDYQ